MMRIPEEKEQNVFGLLRLARRARAITVGMDATLAALNREIVKLVIVANDIGKNSLKRISKSIDAYEADKDLEKFSIPLLALSNTEQLGKILNKETVSIIGLIDDGFARGISRLAQQDEDNE